MERRVNRYGALALNYLVTAQGYLAAVQTFDVAVLDIICCGSYSDPPGEEASHYYDLSSLFARLDRADLCERRER